jgi:hypothetical protein
LGRGGIGGPEKIARNPSVLSSVIEWMVYNPNIDEGGLAK